MREFSFVILVDGNGPSLTKEPGPSPTRPSSSAACTSSKHAVSTRSSGARLLIETVEIRPIGQLKVEAYRAAISLATNEAERGHLEQRHEALLQAMVRRVE